MYVEGTARSIRAFDPQVCIDALDAVAVMEHKFTEISRYSAHLRKVFQDKSLLWSQRSIAMLSAISPDTACDFLMICSDAIDQSHWCLPRHPGLRALKSLSSYRRPVVVVLCVWVVGFLVRFFVLDQDQAHDASCCAECVSRTLEEVVVILQAVGRTMPPCVIYWASLAAL